MQFDTTQDAIPQIEADVLVVGVFQDRLPEPAAAVNAASNRVIERLIESGEFKPEVGKAIKLYYLDGVKSPLTIVTGLGAESEFGAGSLFRACATASRMLSDKPRDRVVFCAEISWSERLTESAVAGSVVGCQGPGWYQADPGRKTPARLTWHDASDQAARAGVILGDSINFTRRLVDEPPQVIYPESFANVVSEMASSETNLAIEVWDQQRLEQERCGAMLAVAKGSSRPPRLLILRHDGASPDTPWLALVGKGVTFDSGGLSLKPSESMKTMKCDMAGAATVVGAMRAISKLKLPANVIGLTGLVENMPGGAAYKLGDVLTARNGKTIEVHNTDAEGRLVLADVLSVAVDRDADQIIDLATLTGACVVALGLDVAGLMTNDQASCDQIKAAAEACGEPVWQLPMFPEYAQQIKGTVGDIKNVGEGRWGGAITAAKLLEEFVADTPWTHIDIAGPAFLEKPKPWLDTGGSGALVRTLVELVRMKYENLEVA